MKGDLSEIHQLCIQKNLTFATFRLPHQSEHISYIQTTPRSFQWKSIHDLKVKQGFIMAPFDTRNGKTYIHLKPDIIIHGTRPGQDIIENIRSVLPNPLPEWEMQDPVITGRDEYIEQVRTIKNNISTGGFQKAVLSRISQVKGKFIPLITNIFHEVCRRHPNAFVYLFKSNEHFWLGASPEPMLRLSDGIISTVSLAGTRPFSEKNMNLENWTMKEVLEQEYVTRYIHDILREFGIRDYRVTSPYAKKAGDLVHLRTDFSLRYEQLTGRIWEFLDALHPTPAVAGQPKEDAIRFIKQLEPHDREYYAGFLGPVQADDRMDLFVNLRSMKITPDYLALYVGGGITLESVPEDEWDETNWKAESLLGVIKAYANQTEGHYAV